MSVVLKKKGSTVFEKQEERNFTTYYKDISVMRSSMYLHRYHDALQNLFLPRPTRSSLFIRHLLSRQVHFAGSIITVAS
ncbi:hypothetical protein FKM82_003187 [Ascaphus truei]